MNTYSNLANHEKFSLIATRTISRRVRKGAKTAEGFKVLEASPQYEVSALRAV
ncbi:MAG: hypothetical protein K2K25_11910 [Muribaculaceae bacterium]|nr:hypothetical protein [Muribaculaceae bacterium]